MGGDLEIYARYLMGNYSSFLLRLAKSCKRKLQFDTRLLFSFFVFSNKVLIVIVVAVVNDGDRLSEGR